VNVHAVCEFLGEIKALSTFVKELVKMAVYNPTGI